jgi:hypothetical protein
MSTTNGPLSRSSPLAAWSRADAPFGEPTERRSAARSDYSANARILLEQHILLLSFALNLDRPLHPLDPLGTRRSRLKRVTEILGLTNNLFILKFHDTHRIRWLPVVSEDEFGHPEIGSTNNSPH